MIESLMSTHESELVLPNGVRGTLAEPHAARSQPAVLMLHGFASHRDEVGNLYARLAAALAVRGIGSLRIDFRGWGSSDGNMAATTVGGQLEDARAACLALCRQAWVEPQRIGVIGFSLGASIALLAASADVTFCRSLVLWSGSLDLRAAFLHEMGQAAFDAAARDGQVTVDLGFRTVTLGSAFFDSLGAYDFAKAIGDYRTALFTIAGSEDYSARSLEAFQQGARSALKASYCVPHADHIFNVLGKRQAIADDVIEKTVAWFAMTLLRSSAALASTST
jgi:uncharacterized protein